VAVSEGGDKVFGHHGVLPERPKRAQDARNWRLASVTKQVVAVLVMQEVAAGRIELDQPISRYLPRFAGPNASKVTIRQLLQHRSGLPNPDDTETPAGQMPAFYRSGYSGSRDPVTGYCAGAAKGEPGGNWVYNNCDYIVLGAVLENVTGKSWAKLVEERIAKPLRLKTFRAFPTKRWVRWGSVGGKREPEVDLATFGASAGLYGSAEDVLTFNNALMDGRLLAPEALAEMWKGDPALGYMGLGQWAFAAKLGGCEAPVRLIERRGAIGGIGVRNFIAPERKVAMVILSDRGEFDFGEVWQGRGPSHDMLSAVLCPTPAK
jgi:CubicO group peptidase (beta-lactamase class C family)